MAHILVDLKKVEEIRKLNLIDSGKEGSCYFLSDTEVIKIFHILDNKRKIYFDDLKFSNIAFPEDIYIYENTGLIQGYTMPYLEGEKFVDGFSKRLLLSDLKNAIINMKNVIARYPFICMYDLSLTNMLFDYKLNQIKLIDTGKWYKKEDSKKENINTFNYKIMLALIRGLDWLNHPLNQDSILHDIYRMHKIGESLPIEFLEELERKISLENGEKVKTIGDLERKVFKKSWF